MANSSPVDFFRYSIKAGDSLSLILAKFYNLGFHSPDYAKRLAQILSLNPHIKNPNLIYSGTSLLLPSPNISSATLGAVITAQFQDQMCLPDLSYGAGLLPSVSKDDEANLWLLSWLAENSNALTISGGILLGRSEEHTSELQSRPHLVCRLLLEKKKQILTSTLALHHHISYSE